MLARRRVGQLGNRVFRVYAASSGEPHRLDGDDAPAVENFAGGDFALGVRPVRDTFRQAGSRLKLPLGRTLHRRRRFLHLPRLSGAFDAAAPVLFRPSPRRLRFFRRFFKRFRAT